MPGKQVTELDALPSFTDTSLLPVHNGAGLKKGLLSQLASYLGNKFSNPNLLINPDFRVNQRGSANYTSNGYTVDRWRINSGTVKASSSGITVTLNNKGQFIQRFDNTLSGTYTATIKVTSITGDCVLFIGSHSLQLNKAGTFTITENGSITDVSLYKNTAGTCTINVEYIKLEKGSVSTMFVAPNPAEELTKCQRYFMYLPSSMTGYRFSSEIYVYIENLDKMRTDGTIGITGNNNDTNLLFGGNTLQMLKVNVSATSVNHAKKFAKVYLDGITSLYHDTTLGIDMNSTKIYVDAEIY